MIWNDHSKLKELHAFLSPSSYHWLSWEPELLEQRYYNQYAQTVGTIIHSLAETCIKNRVKLNKSDKHLIDITLLNENIPKSAYDSENILDTLVPFVNDSIGFRMRSEEILYYSYYCFGTADAITFDERTHTLRIHDLKTGITPAHMEQLLIYTAIFCLEYCLDPSTFKTILRIYQNGEIVEYEPSPDEITDIMNTIVEKSNMLTNITEGDK